MKILPFAAALAATIALTACGQKPAGPVVNTDPNSANFTGAEPGKPVELPPMPKSAKSYRCDDQSIVAVQVFQGDKQANVTIGKGVPTVLKAEDAGKPFVADGYELTIVGDEITLTTPEHAKQKCTG